MIDVVVIGAGLAGIHCAQSLSKQGFSVALFDKSRGIGGRLATRRVDNIRLDHGLPSWEILGEHTAKLTKQLLAADMLQPWLVLESDENIPAAWRRGELKTHFMAPDGMTAIAKFLASEITIHRAHHLVELKAESDHWQLLFQNESVVLARTVILAMPYPQIQPLIEEFSPLSKRLDGISYEPSLSLMLGYASLSLDFPWQELRLDNHPIFRKIILDGQKRSPQSATLVVQTHEDFAQSYLDAESLDAATAQIIETLQNTFDITPPLWSQIHRWRYALPKNILNCPYLALGTSLPLIACGDWCLGNGIEGAIASGIAAAESLTN
ncbi:MAG: NAD(P)-binding protein [Limnothrix sp. RL_2_0]|nr:NAD(P)-binding protein [Limnothrix sp. RL_2_0]